MRRWISALVCVVVGACAGRPASLLPQVEELAARQEVERQNAILLADFRDKLIHATTVYATIARANADHIFIVVLGPAIISISKSSFFAG